MPGTMPGADFPHRIDCTPQVPHLTDPRRRQGLHRQRREALAGALARLPRPPYYVQGKQLYYAYYQHADHELIATLVGSKLQEQRWIVSYDNAPEIRKLYQRWRWMTYSIGYSARDVREGREVMFFCDNLKIPPLAGSMHKGRIDNAPARRRSAGLPQTRHPA